MTEETVHGFKKVLQRHLDQCSLGTITNRLRKNQNKFHGYDIEKEQRIHMLRLELDQLIMADWEKENHLILIKNLENQLVSELEDMACDHVNSLSQAKLLSLRRKVSLGNTIKHAFKGEYVNLNPYIILRGDMELQSIEEESKKSQAKYQENPQWGAFE